MIALLLMLTVQAAQSDALFSGSVPADVPTFQIIQRGREPYYAGLKVDGKWVQDRNAEFKPSQEVDIFMDTPWQAQEPLRTTCRNLEVKYETPVMRRNRLEKSWEARGYIFRETANGRIPVLQEDAAYAERARNMVAAVRASRATAPASNPSGAEYVPPATVSEKGNTVAIAVFVTLVLAAGAALLFLVYKKMIAAESA
ncbi:MAG: hypothetical protein GX580_17560 [Candidatus Hydrogenedens sp.]|nr:hypothetical protein [Candidatus Hydrogenedentota bacterium]NLF59437.1 hypothetical protein [Candidatus Hydrogenedens sp.]